MNAFLEQSEVLRREQCAIHRQALEDYLACITDPAAHARAGVSDDELAFLVLQHAGLLWRYTASEALLSQLQSLPVAVRDSLVRSAAGYMQTFRLKQRVEKIVSHDALSDDEMQEVESVLLARDAAQAALDLARRIVGRRLSSKQVLLRELALAQCAIGAADELLLQRPDVIAVASRILEPLRALLKVTLDTQTYWWFFHARALDAQFEKELADSVTLARSLGLPADVFVRKSHAKVQRAEPAKMLVRGAFTQTIVFPMPMSQPAEQAMALAAHTGISPMRRLASQRYVIENAQGGFTLSECENDKYLAFEADASTTDMLEGARLIASHTNRIVTRIKNGCACFLKPDKLSFILKLKNGKHVAVALVKPSRRPARRSR